MSQEQDQQPHFINNGVFVDDPFDEDPFKDEDINLQAEPEKPTQFNLNNDSDSEKISKIVPEFEEEDSVVFENKPLQPKNISDEQTNPININAATNQQLDHIVRLLDTQIVSANEQQSKLFKALDKTLTTFIDEFSPTHLEDVYSDFGTPMFASKEKQYWRLYRKSFNRRLDKGEYHRLFKALLLENMQSKD